MKDDVNALLSALQRSVEDALRPTLFSHKDAQDLTLVTDSCIAFLKAQGYDVKKINKPMSINTIEDLVDYFYHKYNNYKAVYIETTSNKQRDLALMSRFVKHRAEELGIDVKIAMQDVPVIIDYLFKYEEQLNLPKDIGIWVFGLGKCKFITDKIISLINQHYHEHNDAVVYRAAQNWDRKHAHECKGFDFDEIFPVNMKQR